MSPRCDAERWTGVRIHTIGHSTWTLDELVAVLRGFGVGVLADVRTVPRSRHNPQFNREALGPALNSRGLQYAHLADLGGLRHARQDSPNTGWRNASFRGYADYMATEAFETGLAALRALAEKGDVAIMCAEAVPWRCHRSLIADALTVRGAAVRHIIGGTRASAHRLTAFARVEGVRVTYPGDDPATGRLATPGPFHLEATVRVLQRRPVNLVDVWAVDRYRRVLRTPEGVVLVEVANHGTVEEPDLRFVAQVGAPTPAARVTLAATLRRVLGLDVDPAPLQATAERERKLRPAAEALRGMRPPRFPDLFEAFANVVPFQQVSLDSGAAIVARFVKRFGETLAVGDGDSGNQVRAFPTAEVVAGARLEALRACGLSARKADAVRGLARTVASGEVTAETLERMSTADAVKALVDLRGIGPWSAAVVMLRGFGRLDLFPPGDVGAQRGLGTLTGLGPGVALERLIARFGDHRGYLYFYALGTSLLARGLIHPAPRRPESRRRRSPVAAVVTRSI